MWTQISLRLRPLWDDVSWHVTASWLDDPGLEPVTLVKSGTVPLHGVADPHAMLLVVVNAMAEEIALDRASPLAD